MKFVIFIFNAKLSKNILSVHLRLSISHICAINRISIAILSATNYFLNEVKKIILVHPILAESIVMYSKILTGVEIIL